MWLRSHLLFVFFPSILTTEGFIFQFNFGGWTIHVNDRVNYRDSWVDHAKKRKVKERTGES